MTTIVLVRKNNEVVVAGDGQVSMGNTVIKKTANKVRKIEKRNVIAGFAGSTADALTLFERLESKLEKHAGNLARAAVELAKDWRTDKYLRRLEALMAVGDKENSFIISGTGDVLEPEGDVIGIGSGGNYALASANLDNLLDISVLPTPVGPIIKIFLGKTSSLISPFKACLLHLFLRAIATALLALF